MKQFYLILFLLGLAQTLMAQEPNSGEQLLVFRNTGVVDLLYTNKVDSIVTNDNEQVFYTKDTVLVVPIAELDSVAVGSRNEKKLFDNVKELSKTGDLPWITRFDGQSIYYRKNTPAYILPSVGMKLFYGMEEHQTAETIFPYGLTVKVTNITNLSEEIRVDIDNIPLDEIFERLFYAGPITISQPNNVKRRVPVSVSLDLDHVVKVEDMGSIDVNGNVEIEGDVVINVFPLINKNDSHADLKIKYGFGFDATLEARENSTYNYEEFLQEIRVRTIYGILNIDAAVGAFANMAAELNLGVGIQRTYTHRLLWSRNKEGETFEIRAENNEETYKDKAKIDLTLNGKLFFGPLLRVDFVTVGDLVGARAKVKIGPEIGGKLSLGMLQDMRNYQPEYYGEAKLDVYGKASLEGFVINRPVLFWGDVVEHKFLEYSLTFGGYEWNLFPDYSHSNATAITNRAQEVEASVATAIEEPTPTDLETGFDIINENGLIVDSVFVGSIIAEPEDASVPQTFDTEITLPEGTQQNLMNGYTMRPIFHYAGYTVSAAPVKIRKDILLQPYFATQGNGAMTFISSGPFIGSAVKDTTLYQVGMYLPVPTKNNVYQNKKPAIIITEPISGSHVVLLVGTWHGEINGEPFTLMFADNGLGKFNDRQFNYQVNMPQCGELLLSFDNGDSMVFKLVSVTDTELLLIDKQDKNQNTMTMSR